MKNDRQAFSDLQTSGFIRSIITRVLSIFVLVSLVIAAVAFISFTGEIRRSMLLDKKKQLVSVEQAISKRMDEIVSIAYSIGNDPVFYMKPVAVDSASGREMSAMLGRYLVGNRFIEHLAYCRTAEPDIIYTSRGERSLSEFLASSIGTAQADIPGIIRAIHGIDKTQIILAGGQENGFFAFAYPLPQLSDNPQAHVLMMIPVSGVRPLFEALLMNGNGRAAVFDADGTVIFSVSGEAEAIDLTAFVVGDEAEAEYTSPSGQQYSLQKVVSPTNQWTYAFAMRRSDTLTGLANKQIAFIAFILIALVAAVLVMLAIVIARFQPIRRLAAQVAKEKQTNGEGGKIVDEHALLSDTIAALKDDSAQKQKYETAYHEAEAASKAKSAFLSSMSHDIRTPMNAIIGMTAIARKHIGDQAYVDECLKKVQISSDYLLSIINNVLDMSRIESGRIPIEQEPVMIPALIDSLVSLMTSSAEAKSQTIEVDMRGVTDSAVIGDNVHLVQVFVNILSNAIKFTPEGGRITVTVTQTASDDARFGLYSFVFADTGIGIPPEFIDHVFDTFSRADAQLAPGTEGTGLGMAIAWKLAHIMGGDIRCESELGRGSTFTVVMRMRYAEQAPAEIAPIHAHRADPGVIDLAGRRILLVEDNAMNREIARKIIGETDAEIVEANDGKAAVDAFASRPEGFFDLIFMDIQMPVMNGYEATAAIRRMSRPDAATVPIYAMTANTFDEDVRQVRDAGMNGHIGKPYNPPTLYRVLAQALGAPAKDKSA